MKHLTYTLILVAALSLITENSLIAKKPVPVSPPPSVLVSPADYIPGQPIDFTGSGFEPRVAVTISVLGPYSVTLSATADSSGNFAVNFPGGVAFPGGYYTVVASQATHSGTLSATTGLVVE